MNNKQFNLKVKDIYEKCNEDIVSDCDDLMMEHNLSYKQKKLIKRLQDHAHFNIMREITCYLIV